MTNNVVLDTERPEAGEGSPWTAEQVSVSLSRGIEEVLAGPLSRGHRLFMDARGLGIFIAGVSGETPQRPNVSDDRGRQAPPVTLVNTLPCVVKRMIKPLLAAHSIRDWGRATLPFIVLATCPHLRDFLTRDLGQENLIEPDLRQGEWRTMAADSFVAAARIGRIEADCVHRVLAAVSLRLQALGNAAQGWFDRRDDGIRVCWSDPEGRILQEEPLQEFIASASRNLAAHLAHLAQGPDPRALREKGLSLLRQVSPALAGLVADVGMQGCTVGRRLAVVSARHGMPLHIWLYLSESYPSVGTAACILSADRPHGEFILEASDGNLFYFPPCLLSARLVFDGQRVLVEHPRIREPANGYRWGHPYTGDLVRDPFASARVPESAHEALAAPSKWALRTFPTLGTRMPGAGEADLCLEGQSERVQTIAAQLGRDLETGARRALPTAVTALHDLARIGLTTAHQNNASAPRVPLTAERMPYPVPKGVVPDSPHTRVFTYAARRLTASSAPQARAASPPEPLLPGPFQLDFESRMDTGVRRFDSHLRRFLRLR